MWMHMILLGDVKKEVTNLLQEGIIYPISDSQCVSPVQVVPLKTGLTMVKNENNELIPARVQNSWRVCIDYRRVNQTTRKDHFPLPFINQMLEGLAGGQVGLGGQTETQVGAPSPSMGSGHFPDDNFSHTCYFRNVRFQNASRQFRGPPEYLVDTFNDAPKYCYQIHYNDDFPSPIGHALQFGGPGGTYCDH
ncbi:uncharacterized protein [Cicer arietinum]|uniref:uncharacterized protein n=1 Tax=Cicer arietinum TaxID=3827 RepID=UPI000641638F